MHLRSVVPLVLFAATAASTVTCSKWAPETPTPASPKVPIPPAPPPDHGVAHVEISGAIEARHDSAMACAPDMGMGLSVHEPRASAAGHPGWSLAVYQFGTDPARVELTEGGVDWAGELPSGVVPAAAGIAFSDVVLSSADGKTVKASATLRCQDLVTHAVPDALVARLHEVSGAEVRPFVGADFGRAKDARGISVKVDPGSTKALVSVLRGNLPAGWVAYVGTSRDLSGEMPGGDPRAELTHEVAIGPGADAGDIVRLAHVDPVNFGLDSEDVAARVIDWTDRYKIDVYMADTETLQAEIPPGADIPKLAVEVAAFCPDVVDQGTGTVDALAAEMAKTNNLYCWWD